MAKCSSPGCSGNHPEKESSGCSSPGCPGRVVCNERKKKEKEVTDFGYKEPAKTPLTPIRITQTATRPIDAAPRPGTTVRPEPGNKSGHEPLPGRLIGDPFCRVIYQFNKNWFTIVLVLYPDVLKFGGAKILIFKTDDWNNISGFDKARLDPHFYPDNKTPIGRIIPDDRGLALLKDLINPKQEQLSTIMAILDNLDQTYR